MFWFPSVFRINTPECCLKTIFQETSLTTSAQAYPHLWKTDTALRISTTMQSMYILSGLFAVSLPISGGVCWRIGSQLHPTLVWCHLWPLKSGQDNYLIQLAERCLDTVVYMCWVINRLWAGWLHHSFQPSSILHFSFHTVVITTAGWYYLSIYLCVFGCLPSESVKSKRAKPFLLLQLLKHVVVGAQ